MALLIPSSSRTHSFENPMISIMEMSLNLHGFIMAFSWEYQKPHYEGECEAIVRYSKSIKKNDPA